MCQVEDGRWTRLQGLAKARSQGGHQRRPLGNPPKNFLRPTLTIAVLRLTVSCPTGITLEGFWLVSMAYTAQVE